MWNVKVPICKQRFRGAIDWIVFFGVILVVARWKRPIRPRTAPIETVSGATVEVVSGPPNQVTTDSSGGYEMFGVGGTVIVRVGKTAISMKEEP